MNLTRLYEILSAEVRQPFDYPIQIIARDLILTSVATLARQQYEKTGTFSNNLLISVCVPLSNISSTECCGTDLGCSFPTSDKIPPPIDFKDTLLFPYVGNLTGFGNGFGYLKPDEVPLIKYRKFSSNLPFYTYINGRIIVFNKPALEKIKLRYVPSNPIDLLNFKTCDDNSCFDSEDAIYIPDYWEDTITRLVVPKLQLILNQQITVDEKQQ